MVNYIEPSASSASELVYKAIEDKSLIDEEIAKALYIGMIHDTGVFQYSNTSPETLKIAAELIDYGMKLFMKRLMSRIRFWAGRFWRASFLWMADVWSV